MSEFPVDEEIESQEIESQESKSQESKSQESKSQLSSLALTKITSQEQSRAIATWMNQKLQPHRVRVKAHLKRSRLLLLLESESTPEQPFLVTFVLKELTELGIPSLRSVRLVARQMGIDSVAWMHQFQLLPTESYSAADKPSIDRSSSLTYLRSQAKQGNINAMQQLLNAALAHKQIAVTLMQAGDRLAIHLISDPCPDQTTSLILISREIRQWQIQQFDYVKQIQIKGQTPDQHHPVWEHTLSLPHLLEQQLTPQPRMAKRSMHRQASALATPVDALTQKTIAASLLLSGILLASGQLTFLFSPFITLVHELGHAACAWLFGYFAVPAFDFIYGGGITLQSYDRVWLIMLAIYVGFAWLVHHYRHNDFTSRLLLGVCLLHTLCAYTPIHQILMIGMGHGFELLFAGIFIYRALSGSGCRYSIERPLYGMLGCFTVLYDVRFSWGLLFDPDMRDLYLQGKGGILDHDFVRLANDYFGVDLAAIVTLFLLGCIAIPILSFLCFRYQKLLRYFVYRLVMPQH
ncbi:MAG: hypothetical protein Kow00121_35180 [Elainellaceae cyanobacterium]